MYGQSSLLPYHPSAVNFAYDPSAENAKEVALSVLGKTLIASTALLLCGSSVKESLVSGAIVVSSLEAFSMAYTFAQKSK